MTRRWGGLWIGLGLGMLSLVAPSAQADEKVEGYAEWHVGHCLLVDGQRVCPGPRTRFKGEAHDLASIPLGYEVKAKGERGPDGAIVAREVEAKPNGEALFEGDLRREFDEIEELYRREGRLFDVDEDGEVSEDYGRILTRGRDVQRVNAILEDLVPPYLDPEEFRLYVVENEEWNAMAAPNGAIFVFTGLLDAMDDDEVALVLGHELAHATHEHSRRSYKKGLWIQLATAGAAAIAEETIDSDVARVAAQGMAFLAGMAWSNSYGRGLEDQADRVGMRYAFEAGYDVTKAPRLWHRFAERYGSLPKVVHFFVDEHSRSEARAQKLARELALNYGGGAGRDRVRVEPSRDGGRDRGDGEGHGEHEDEDEDEDGAPAAAGSATYKPR